MEAGNARDQFTGMTTRIDASRLPAGITPDIQIRVTNQQGLHTFGSKQLGSQLDQTPPTPLEVFASAEENDEGEFAFTAYLGSSEDQESGIANVRYRIRDLRHADSTLVNWRRVSLRNNSKVFAGHRLRTTLPSLEASSTYLIEVEISNHAGLTSTTSSIFDLATQNAYQNQAPAQPLVDLFHFSTDNVVRSNEIEVSITPDPALYTSIDSVQYRYALLDGQDNLVGEHSSTSWNTSRFRTQSPQQPIIKRIQLPDATDVENVRKARIEVRLINANGISAIQPAYIALNQSVDDSEPVAPEISFMYSGYHHSERANELDLQIKSARDDDSRISEVSYRVVNAQNADDIIIDWTNVSTISQSGLFSSADVNLSLPEFSRNRLLKIEARATNGVGLVSTSDTTLAVTVDRTPPVIETPVLFVSGANDVTQQPLLNVSPGKVTDEESHIVSIAYRVTTDVDSLGTLVDWTNVDVVSASNVRMPSLALPLSRDLLTREFVLELEAQNEAGLTSNARHEVKARLDNSPPQMPRVQMSYEESELGTGYLRIEPGAFRDAESNIASLEYRLVDSEDPDFVLIDWINIPVPDDIRVSVSPIAIPRSEIPFDGAVLVAAEFRATNGAGLLSVRRSTVDLPGDTSPPDSPSLILAHRNAYDPLNPNTVEIQIGSSEDNQSSIAQAQYRITNASTGEELTSWTQLQVASEGYFPGTIVFKELPLIQSSTSLLVEVEVVNTAGLINRISQNVRVDVQSDVSPPVADISLHYFENEMSLVLDELSDYESKIQKVEYRFLDNVDQSELQEWTDLFEIAIPQDAYPKQSYKVRQPDVQSGRTLKVEVRVTNGAGLQTTVSKTVLVRSPNSGQ